MTAIIHGKTEAGETVAVRVSDEGTLAVSATVEPPEGGATEAKQDVAIVALASIDGKLPALGQALAAASVPVVLTAAQQSALAAPVLGTGSNTIGAVTAPGAAALALDASVSGLTGKFPSAASPADNAANPSVSGIMAFGMGYNPALSQWGRPRIDSSFYAQVRAAPFAPTTSSRSTSLQIQRTISAFSCTPKRATVFAIADCWVAFFNASSAVADGATPFGGHVYRLLANQTLDYVWHYQESFTTGFVIAALSQVESAGSLSTVVETDAILMITGQAD